MSERSDKITEWMKRKMKEVSDNPNIPKEDKEKLYDVIISESYKLLTGEGEEDAEIKAKQKALLDMQLQNEKIKHAGMETAAFAYAYLMGRGKGPWETP